ncbi:50S ribosomal protein L13 [Kallotenue papyrolyticum]|uniref:50S ribosomal protein L13 n=1 Tax=Kallotenue papyrolyticum TaxID=1325125 RepID=UPI0004B8B964|nr:50S ribosomal protein L13 [Kallotenue papyrolyticum]
MASKARLHRTWTPKASEIQRDWLLVDADGQILGRLASQIATLLRGKHKPTFTPHLDNGDFVVVVNAEKVRVTGRKPEQKQYYTYSGYPGGLKVQTYRQLMQRHPTRVLKLAVKRMLPKNRLGRKLLRKLHIYAGPRHPHAAQQPKPYQLGKLK